jgi:hypothetical protein
MSAMNDLNFLSRSIGQPASSLEASHLETAAAITLGTMLALIVLGLMLP